MIPFQKKWCYSPEISGSYSIKFVLLVLVPKQSYNDLEINEGGDVSNTFLSLVNETFEIDIIRKKKTTIRVL